MFLLFSRFALEMSSKIQESPDSGLVSDNRSPQRRLYQKSEILFLQKLFYETGETPFQTKPYGLILLSFWQKNRAALRESFHAHPGFGNWPK